MPIDRAGAVLGEEVCLVDGSGVEYRARIERVVPGRVELAILERKPSAGLAPVRLHAAQGCLKDKKMDRVVRQLCELGVARFIPLISERAVARPESGRAASRQERWRKICIDALKQSRRGDLMEIEDITALGVLLKADHAFDCRILFWEGAAQSLAAQQVASKVPEVRSVLVVIGPEGGFSDTEAAAAAAAGFWVAKLGPRILRAETAAVAACGASIALAKEKGSFPFYERENYLSGEFIATLPAEIRDAIAEHGIHNSHLLAIAPTGTISLLANNISSGLEPVFSWEYQRRILGLDGNYVVEAASDYAWRLWRELHPEGPLPAHFVTALQLPPRAHIQMQAALQPYVDNAISKTINIPESMPFEDYKAVFDLAYDSGLKGCTTFRPNPDRGSILEQTEQPGPCCTIEREAD